MSPESSRSRPLLIKTPDEIKLAYNSFKIDFIYFNDDITEMFSTASLATRSSSRTGQVEQQLRRHPEKAHC